jgi:two-component system sensor histidine kinase UhpB
MSQNKTQSLHRLINNRIAFAALAILCLTSILTIWQAKQSVKNELDSSLKLVLQLIQLSIDDKDFKNHSLVDDWLPKLVSIEQTRHLSIQLVRANAESVRFASAQTKPSSNPPPAWFISLIAAESPRIEQKFTDSTGENMSIIIQANPTDEIAEAWKESSIFFLMMAVFVSSIFFAVNMVFTKSFTAINTIINTLKIIETGHYHKKLPAFNINEYDNIANAINHMTQVMSDAQQENKALIRHNLMIQEDERKNLAKELHDELGQSITAIKVMAVTAKQSNHLSVAIADHIAEVCDNLITEVRQMMRHLHPLSLSELGLKASLEDLLNQWQLRYPQLTTAINCSDEVDRLTPDISMQIYRIIQECLTNIVRHADATNAWIDLQISPENCLIVALKDNGKGCSVPQLKNGFGLLGMRERVSSIHGEFSIVTGDKLGMKITASIPLS